MTRLHALAAVTAVALGSMATAQAANLVDLHARNVNKINSD